MLEQTVEELKSGEAAPPEIKTTLSLGMEIRLPSELVPDPNHRLQLCKEIASARDDAELASIRAEMEDRFGHLPPQAHNLFALASLRLLAESLRVQQIERRGGRIHIAFSPDARIDVHRLAAWTRSARDARLTPAGTLQVPAPPRPEQIPGVVREVLQALA